MPRKTQTQQQQQDEDYNFGNIDVDSDEEVERLRKLCQAGKCFRDGDLNLITSIITGDFSQFFSQFDWGCKMDYACESCRYRQNCYICAGWWIKIFADNMDYITIAEFAKKNGV